MRLCLKDKKCDEGLGWGSAAERLLSMGQAILALSKEKDKKGKTPWDTDVDVTNLYNGLCIVI